MDPPRTEQAEVTEANIVSPQAEVLAFLRPETGPIAKLAFLHTARGPEHEAARNTPITQ